MCLEIVLIKVSKLYLLYYIFTMKVTEVVPQRFPESPCPNTFQYRYDPNGLLYGSIGVYSFDKRVVRLSVQFSVGNEVNNYKGHLELVKQKDAVADDIQNGRAIRYKMFFPPWENIPPKITRISVNGDVVCSGATISTNDWFGILTTITLHHMWSTTTELSPLPNPNQNPFGPNNIPITNDNPFLRGDGRDTIRPDNQFPVDNFKHRVGDNPFLNGEGPPPPPPANTPKTPTRDSSRTTRPRTTPSRTTRPRTKPPQSSNSRSCGDPVIANPLIVNGDAVPLGAFPWLTAMFATTGVGIEYKCGGTLVSKRHVVTAAHCVTQSRKRISPDKLLLVLGKLNLQKFLPLEGEKFVGAQEIRIHPDYVPLTSDADIAVVTLSEEIEFTKYIRPICLWTESDDIDSIVGQKGKVVGWGRDEFNNSMTAEPKQANLPIVSQEQCLRSSEAFKDITSTRTFCAGERNNNGPCNGDSGSGFIMKRNGRWSLRGIVSISTYDAIKQTCDLTNYVVFTDVSKFKTWLLSIVVI